MCLFAAQRLFNANNSVIDLQTLSLSLSPTTSWLLKHLILVMKDHWHDLRLGQPAGEADHHSAHQGSSQIPLLHLPVEIR